MAARRKVDPLKAKAAKQKKIAIGGMVVLCLLVAVQGPKTMKMLQGPQPTTAAPAPTPAPGAPVTGTPATPVATPGTAAPAPGAVEPGAGAELALVADSDAAPAPEEGQLVTFERFASKDPFAPQAVAAPASGSAPALPAADAGDQGAGDQGSSSGSAGASGGGTAPGSGSSGGSGPVDGGFTPAPADGGSTGSGAPAPAAPSVAAATSISINGTAEDVAVDATFPAAEPTFVLVSHARDGKSVEIGVAGGSYANGEQTITLELGKPLTLQNTADGSRYELELLAVAGFAPPKR